MGLGVKHPLILPIMLNLPHIILSLSASPPQPYTLETYWSMNQITILQHLGKQKAILEITISTSLRLIDIIQFRKATPNNTIIANSNKSIPSPVAVGLVTSGSVSVVETLDDFRTKDIIAVCDVETSFLVENGIFGGWLRVVSVVCSRVFLDPAEDFRPDTGQCADVGIVAAVYELKADINVFWLFEDETAEDEGPTVEAGNFVILAST